MAATSDKKQKRKREAETSEEESSFVSVKSARGLAEGEDTERTKTKTLLLALPKKTESFSHRVRQEARRLGVFFAENVFPSGSFWLEVPAGEIFAAFQCVTRAVGLLGASSWEGIPADLREKGGNFWTEWCPVFLAQPELADGFIRAAQAWDDCTFSSRTVAELHEMCLAVTALRNQLYASWRSTEARVTLAKVGSGMLVRAVNEALEEYPSFHPDVDEIDLSSGVPSLLRALCQGAPCLSEIQCNLRCLLQAAVRTTPELAEKAARALGDVEMRADGFGKLPPMQTADSMCDILGEGTAFDETSAHCEVRAALSWAPRDGPQSALRLSQPETWTIEAVWPKSEE